jgi:hypothetical protein
MISSNLSRTVEGNDIDLPEFAGKVTQIASSEKLDELTSVIDELVTFFDMVEHRSLLDLS